MQRLTSLLFRRGIKGEYPKWELTGFYGYGRVMRVIDGDTLDVGIIKGLSRYVVRMRIKGVDVPETRTHNADEKKCGERVKYLVIDKLAEKTRRIVITGHDKYGRALGDIKISDTEWLSNWLCTNKYAQEYYGGTKKPFDPTYYEDLLKY